MVKNQHLLLEIEKEIKTEAGIILTVDKRRQTIGKFLVLESNNTEYPVGSYVVTERKYIVEYEENGKILGFLREIDVYAVNE